MARIYFVQGDATQPIGEGNKYLVHLCNDKGYWGRGFVLAISKKWKAPEKAFKKWLAANEKPKLGDIQLVSVTPNLTVINCIGQKGIRKYKGDRPIRYDAVRIALEKIVMELNTIKDNTSTIHMPRIGCGLAGGKWEEIEPIIKELLIEKEYEVYVYGY